MASVFCRSCQAAVQQGTTHTCRALARPYSANAAAVQEEATLREHVPIVEGELVQNSDLERLEAWYHAPSSPAPYSGAEMLIDEVNRLGRETKAAVHDASDLPGVLSELQALSRALRDSGSTGRQPRSARQQSRAAKRCVPISEPMFRCVRCCCSPLLCASRPALASLEPPLEPRRLCVSIQHKGTRSTVSPNCLAGSLAPRHFASCVRKRAMVRARAGILRDRQFAVGSVVVSWDRGVLLLFLRRGNIPLLWILPLQSSTSTEFAIVRTFYHVCFQAGSPWFAVGLFAEPDICRWFRTGRCRPDPE